MAHALAALLLCLASAPLHAQEDRTFTSERSDAMKAQFDPLMAQFPAIMDASEAARKTYAAAKEEDKDALLAQWEATFGPAHQLIKKFEPLFTEHKRKHNAMEFLRVTRAIKTAAFETNVTMRHTAELKAVQDNQQAMARTQGILLQRFYAEGDRFKEAYEARKAVKASERQNKKMMPLLLAAGAVVLVLASWAAWRHAYAVPEELVLAVSAGSPIPAVLKAQTVPAVIGGNIDVVRPIGRGGMGEVYEGLDRTLQRRVALKRLRSELTNSPNDLSRLLAEARLVAALKHDNIVAIHAVEMEAGQVFLVFEYVDGPSLSAHIAQFRQIAWPEALRIFSGAAAALGAAHAKDIVHRDLKPGNIMLDSKGVVKVMDFGIAHQAAQAVSRLTRSGAWGTPPYMSPEQELGEVNKGVDLFALNVCFYEMLTGELPFTGPNFLAQKRERVYIPVTQAVPALPKALDAFFATAFDPDPAKRFPDALALAAAANAVA